MYQLNPFLYAPLGEFERLFNTPGKYQLSVPRGRYVIKICGGGGAGGQSAGASGGAGGTAQPQTFTVDVINAGIMNFYVGFGGKSRTNGGNGGAANTTNSTHGGDGGGGGHPSYVTFVGLTKDANTPQWLYSLGGGGGGGGGSAFRYARYADGAGSAGGGGYYRFNDGKIESVPGKNGVAGGACYYAGNNGVAGNTTDFPDLQSGHGSAGGYGSGDRTNGGQSARGGGASGGSGGGSAGNHSSAYGGAGAPGAGGCPDAGGGQSVSSGTQGTNASNFHSVPTPGYDYKDNLVTSGWGVGGTPGNPGADGWIWIYRVMAPDEIKDTGLITDTVSSTIDAGTLEDGVANILNLGNI